MSVNIHILVWGKLPDSRLIAYWRLRVDTLFEPLEGDLLGLDK